MLKTGTLRMVGSHYRNHPAFSREVRRGMREFFGDDRARDTDDPHFNEWMLYDFVFDDGRTMLQKFCEDNPLTIPDTEMALYLSLEENYYGLYLIISLRPLSGFVLERLSDGKQFDVSEVSATIESAEGDVIAARVAHVIDHYELVGANSFMLPLSAMSKKKRDEMIAALRMVIIDTPKDALALVESFARRG